MYRLPLVPIVLLIMPGKEDDLPNKIKEAAGNFFPK